MTTLTQYVAWAERQIARVVVADGLHVGCAGVVQGPMTLTFRLRLLQPNRVELGRLLALGPALAQALQSPKVRVSDTANGVLVEVPSPAPRTPSADALARYTAGPGRVAVGLDAFRRPVFLDFSHTPHLLAVGPTRRGKTEAVKSLLYGLAVRTPAHRLAYVILAKKQQTWATFALAAGCYGVVSDDAAIEAALSWLAGDVLQTRTRNGVQWPAVFIVCDDLANIAARARIGSYLGELASMGGGVGLHLLLSTQTTGRAGGLTADLEANLTARLVFGATDAAAAARYAGGGGTGADLVGAMPGDALLIIDGTPQRVATACADDRMIALLPAGDTPQPWQKPAQNRQNRLTLLPKQDGEGKATGMGGPEPVAEPFAFDLSQPVSPSERETVQALYAGLGSLSKTCKAAYGSKNGRTWQRLQDALAEHRDALDEIDLSTEASRAAYAEIERAGLILSPSEVLQ